MMKKKIVLYGMGMNFDIFMEYANLDNVDIVALVDRFKYGSYWNNWLIRHPEELKTIDFDEVYLLIKDNEAAIDYLIHEIQIDSSRIRCTYEINRMHLMNEDLGKYRYVMFTDTQDYSNYPYNDLKNRPDFAMKATMDQKGEWKYTGTPHDDETIFIFCSHCYFRFREDGLVPYIRKKYPKSKMVFLLNDTCDGDYGYIQFYGDGFIEEIKSLFDLIITYCQKEAEKYGLAHYFQTYPSHPSQEMPVYDVLFLGHSKDRLEILHRVFKHLKSNGVTCRFWITNVEEEDKLNDPDIIYNQRLTYETYLQEVGKCHCILEICKIDNETTYRFAEAVINNKKLIMNDSLCKNRKYYSEEFMQYIKEPEDIDCAWIKENNVVDYKYEGDFAPENFLKFLENSLF